MILRPILALLLWTTVLLPKETSEAFVTLTSKGISTLIGKKVYQQRPRAVQAIQYVHTPLLSLEEKSKIGLGKTAIIAGATGYIGKAVVAESVQRGYRTVALVRNKDQFFNKEANGTMVQLQPLYAPYFKGAILEECDVENPVEIEAIFTKYANQLDVVCSCLASATGIKGEPKRIDYQATLNLLNCCRKVGGRHFILLSAFCVAKPLLELQRQKLRFEAELTSQNDVTYSIVRPTAFFKSVSGQLEGILRGAPYVLFGKGDVTRCNPIAKEDLAYFMMDSAVNKEKLNKIMNIGGPDGPLTNQMLAEMMYKSLGTQPKFVYAPTWIFDVSIGLIEFIAKLTKDEKWDDVLETARIGKYYAVEDMLTTKEEEKFGTITMQQHYDKLAKEGQDPFTPVRATAIIGRILEAGPVVLTSALLLGVGTLAVT